MKALHRLVAVLASATLVCAAHAGTIFYVPVPSSGSDAGSGITDADDYTTLASAAAAPGDETVLNGMAVQQLEIADNAATTTGLTYSADTGTLVNGGGAGNVPVDGVIATLMSKRIFNDGAGDGSEQYIVLDSATLQAGATYDLRVYIANGGGQQRWVNLAFVGDGLDPVETDFFNEDDATTSPGAFTSADQVYYIDYRFTWDGATDPGVTITQRSGAAPFVLYMVANRVLPAAPLPPAPRALTSTTSRSRSRSSGPAPAAAPAPEAIAAVDQIGSPAQEFVDAPALQQAGSWVDLEGYGQAWQPNNANLPPDWSPYTRGQWVNSEEDGWTFVSDPTESDWAEITNHYGRYVNIVDRGWFWTPGTVWSGAWVSWREGPDYLGWAPLPPDVPYGGDVGISTWVDAVYGLGPSIYNFVPIAQFGVPNVSDVIINRTTAVNIFNQTTNITNITNNTTFVNNRYVNNVYNSGPQLAAVNNYINRHGGTPISQVHVNKVSATDLKGHPGGIKNGVLTAQTPVLHPGAQTHGPKVTKPIVDKGWTGVKDPAAAAAARKRIAAEGKGKTPQDHPAQPPQTAQHPGGAPGKQPGKKPGGPAHPGGPLVDNPGAGLGKQPAGGAKKPGMPSTQPVAGAGAGAKKPGGTAGHPQGANVPNSLVGPNAGPGQRAGVKKPGGPVSAATGGPSTVRAKAPGTRAPSAAPTAANAVPPKPGVKRPGMITGGPAGAGTRPGATAAGSRTTPGTKAPGAVAQQPPAAQAPATRGKKPGQKGATVPPVTTGAGAPSVAGAPGHGAAPLVDAPPTTRPPGPTAATAPTTRSQGKKGGSSTRPPAVGAPPTAAAPQASHPSAPIVDAPPTTRPPSAPAPSTAAAPTTRGKKGSKTAASAPAPQVSAPPAQPKPQPQPQVSHPQPKPQAQPQAAHPQPKPQTQAQASRPQPKPQPQVQQPHPQVQQPRPQVQQPRPQPKPQPQVQQPHPQVQQPRPQVQQPRPQPQVQPRPVAPQPAVQGQPQDPRKKKNPYGL